MSGGISRQRARNANQQDEANLLLADLYYDFGLYEESREIFSRLLTAEVVDSIQSRIWFNLARLRYEQGPKTPKPQTYEFKYIIYYL